MAEPIRPITTRRADKSLTELVSELWALVVAYVMQETVDPLKALVQYVAYGVAGGVFLSLGAVLLAVGGLRAIQTETDHLTGNLTWVPYLIIVVLCVAVAAVGVSRIGKRPQGRQQ